MFGIGFQEMLIILVVVLIFFGPKRLPDLAKSLGKGIAEFKKASEEVRKGIDEAVQEAETDETRPDAPPSDETTPDAPPSGDEPREGPPPSSASDPASTPSTPKG
jgi:TatA/E family protein of Tat protein translocase